MAALAFFLRLFGPWRSAAVEAGVSHSLAEMLVVMHDHATDDVAIIGVGAELLFGLGKIGVGHGPDCAFGISGRLIQLLDFDSPFETHPLGRRRIQMDAAGRQRGVTFLSTFYRETREIYDVRLTFD